MKESTNREKDSSVVHAFSSFGVYPITDQKVAKTIQVYGLTFCGQYAINQQDNKAGLPGVLLGRYPGDSYAGGNPWQLLTAVLGKTFYQGASVLMESNGFTNEVEVAKMKDWEDKFRVFLDKTKPALIEKMGKGEWDEKIENELKASISEFKKQIV